MDTNGLKDNLDWYIMAAQFKFGWALGITAWRSTLSLTYGFVSLFVARYIEAAIPEDKEWLKALFNHRGYRLAALLFKVATSIELPKAARKPTGNTDHITK